MERMKGMLRPGLILLGVLVGGYLTVVSNSGIVLIFGGAVLGGALGAVLYGVIDWFRSRRESGSWSGSSGLDEQGRVNHSADTQARDATTRIVEEEFLNHRPQRRW